MNCDMKTKEPQYQVCLDLVNEKKPTILGLMANQVWNTDPKRLGFVLSRYKFVSKMLKGYNSVLEIGCADAWCSRLVQNEVNKLTVSDFDPIFLKDVNNRMDKDWKMLTLHHNMLDSETSEKYDAIYLIDVFEHISSNCENLFLKNITKSLTSNGVCIIGTPSVQSQKYASKASLEGHVNCKDGVELNNLLRKYFHNVFLFSMNDEVIHTGFEKMAQYLWVICTNIKH